MTKIEQLSAAAQALDEEQIDALISWARSMAEKPFYASAPPRHSRPSSADEEQIARGETVSAGGLVAEALGGAGFNPR